MYKKLSTVISCAMLLCAWFVFAESKVLATGVLDKTFGNNGRTTYDFGDPVEASNVLIQPDNKIVVVGSIKNRFSDSGYDLLLVRFNPNGGADLTFGNAGAIRIQVGLRDDFARAAALQPDGKIVVVGTTQPEAFASGDFLVVRCNQDGTPDQTFGTNGVTTVNQGTTDFFNDVAVQPDGKIVAVGKTSDADSAAAIRFNAAGALDQSFGNGGLVFADFPFTQHETFHAVTLLSDGRILIGGSALQSIATEYLAMLESNGAFAQDFGRAGIAGESADTRSLATDFELKILPDNKILAVSSQSLRRYNSDGSFDQTFRISSRGPGGQINGGTDFAVRADGRIIVLNQRISGASTVVAFNNNGGEINRITNRRSGNEQLADLGSDIAFQNNKFIVAAATADSITTTRFVSITSAGTRLADFDYDEKTDFAVSRLDQSGETVYILPSRERVFSYRLSDNLGGNTRARIIPENFARYAGEFPLFYWRSSQTFGAPAYFVGVNEFSRIIANNQWGATGDIPVGGDYDGATTQTTTYFLKQSEFAVFRPSDGVWYIFNRQNNQTKYVRWGQAGDKPVPADYDYDGITDIAVYRPSNGVWYVLKSTDNQLLAAQFGLPDDVPVTGDYDGDGQADFAVWRPSSGVWYVLASSEGFRAAQFGAASDEPVPGDYDGDGRHDLAVFRNGEWYIFGSERGYFGLQWGAAGDVPLSVRY